MYNFQEKGCPREYEGIGKLIKKSKIGLPAEPDWVNYDLGSRNPVVDLEKFRYM